MSKLWRCVGACAAIALTSICGAIAHAQPALIREPLRIPVANNGAAAELDALVVRRDGSQRLPLAIVNHGSPRRASERSTMSPGQFEPQLRIFAQHGYAAVAVMRRGYGASSGPFVEGQGRCDSPDYVGAARRSAADIADAIRHLQTLPWVDATRVVAIGQSAGGIGVIALGAAPPDGVRAIVNFAGGRGSQSDNNVCAEDRLVLAFGAFGRGAAVPSLWLYAENDLYFRPDLARRFEQAYAAAGGRADLLIVPPNGPDGHGYFRRGLDDWPGRVFGFLRARGLPG